jgi:predicted nucleic acid-binding protein
MNIDKLVSVERKCDLICSLKIQYILIIGFGKNVRQLAISNQLIFYDGCHLHIAMEKGIPIATYDKALIRAAEEKNIEVIR